MRPLRRHTCRCASLLLIAAVVSGTTVAAVIAAVVVYSYSFRCSLSLRASRPPTEFYDSFRFKHHYLILSLSLFLSFSLTPSSLTPSSLIVIVIGGDARQRALILSLSLFLSFSLTPSSLMRGN